MRRYLSIVVGCSVMLWGCGNSRVTERNLRDYVSNEANGVHFEKKHKDIQIAVTYHPNDLVVKQQVEGWNYSPAQIDSVAQTYEPFDYFTLGFSENGREIVDGLAGDKPAFTKAINYLSYGIGPDIRMVHGRDTLFVEDFLYTRNFGGEAGSSLLLAFKSSLRTKSGQVQLIVDERQFGTGLSIFKFDIDDIRAIPPLGF